MTFSCSACNTSAQSTSGNSDDLQSRIEELEKENAKLKAENENVPKEDSSTNTESGLAPTGGTEGKNQGNADQGPAEATITNEEDEATIAKEEDFLNCTISQSNGRNGFSTEHLEMTRETRLRLEKRDRKDIPSKYIRQVEMFTAEWYKMCLMEVCSGT